MAVSNESRILLVSPDPAMGGRIYGFLSESGFTVELVDDGEKAFNRLGRHDFRVLITPLHHSRVDGAALIRQLRAKNGEASAILIISRNEVDEATMAMTEGVCDFQLRPVNLSKLRAVIERSFAYQDLLLRQMALQQRLDSDFGLGRLLGTSRQMLHVYNAVRQSGPLAKPVLLLGEAGTGKSLLAQTLHNNSPRRDGPFVSVDCGVATENSVAEILFGADARFEAANGGTLFLEGISELSPTVQNAVWETVGMGQFVRTGGGHVPIDVRVLAGDVPRLRRRVELGDFHRGLFETLSAITIELPPLRHRQEDIPLLVQEFLGAVAVSGPVPTCTPEVVDRLVHYPWPENVSELRQVVEGMRRNHHRQGPIDLQSLPQQIRGTAEPPEGPLQISVGMPLREAERRLIVATLERCNFDKKKCAKTLGIGLRTLYRKLEEYAGEGRADG